MENKDVYSVKGNAGKGFGTFVLTLSVSLIIFSTVYYFMTSNSSESNGVDMSSNNGDEVVSDFNVKKEESSKEKGEKSVFGEIAASDPTTFPKKEVLAGATVAQETTQSSTSLNTGLTSITVGLFSALALFVFTLIFVYNNPRKLALSTFEKKTTKNL